jgi:predicted Zn-dependent peptidase
VAAPSDEVLDVPTVPEGPGRSIGDGDDDGEGLESQLMLERARQRLLGWQEQPVRVGRYRVLERIGAGGMGVVFTAHDEELDRVVALKILRGELGPGTLGRQRLVREAQATARLSHPNVVHVFEVGQVPSGSGADDQVYMAMTYVRGETLRAWQKGRGPAEIVAMYLQAGEGLAAAHAEGIVHRDFKPDNVLVGGEGRPQIVDFGLARPSLADEVLDEPTVSGSGRAWRNGLDITATGTVLGTPAYMAPEQLARGKPDARSDQFSFCVSLFEALHRRRPFAGTTYTELADNVTAGQMVALDDRGDVPAAVHAIVMRGLSRDPAERYPTMRALLDALAAANRMPVRRRLPMALGGIAVVAAAVAVLVAQPSGATTEASAATERAPQAPPSDPWAEILADSELPPIVETAAPDDPASVTVQRLHNGLSIYVAHRPLEPMVTVVLGMRAGTTEEGADAPGLAMLVQNALVAGTERIGVVDDARERPLRVFQHAVLESLPKIDDPAARDAALASVAASERASAELSILGEMSRANREMGGQFTTLLGGRGAHIGGRLPLNRVGTWLGLAAEVVQRPVFRGFLGRTAEQLAMMTSYDANDEATRARNEVLARATGMHDGGAATLDYLASVPLAAAKDFHARWYRPNNAALVFIGDITPEQARRLAEEHLGAWEPAPLPAVPRVDAPLPERTVVDVASMGGVGVELAWPMPPLGTPEYASLELLALALGGRSGLLASAGDERVRGFGVHIGETRNFRLIAMLQPDRTADDGEQAAMAALEAIAEDRIDAARFTTALADTELDRLAWARGPSSLAHAILSSYFARESWATTRARMNAKPPTRAEVVAAAKLLLGRGVVVVRQRPGEPTPVDLPRLPEPAEVRATHERSAFVRAAIAAPTPVMEPRFLVEGSAYEEQRHGAGRVITTRVDGPIFHMTWIFPLGTAEDPWACDAVRSALPSAAIPGVRIDTFCTPADTRVHILGVAARFDTIAAELVRTVLGPDAKLDVDRHVSMVVQGREMHVRSPYLRGESGLSWALLGDAAPDAKLPPSDRLRAEAKRRIPAARKALAAYDPDVLYVGPDPAALLAVLPPATGLGSPGPALRRHRVIDEPTVFVMDDPTHLDVSVRVLMPWIAETPREQLAAWIHEDVVAGLQAGSPFPFDDEHIDTELSWAPGAPMSIAVAFRVDAGRVVAALEAGVTALRERPPASAFAHTHEVLEAGFRGRRPVPQRVPELVYTWPAAGTDPRVAQWLALPSLTHDDLMAYYDRVDRTPLVLLVVGDVRTIDLDALRRIGKVVQGDPEKIMLDPSQGLRRDDSELMNE